MNTKTYNIFYTLLLLGAFLVAASSVSALWQGPSQTPPGGNISAPLNIGNNAQIKEGNLTLNATNSFLNGLLVPYGNVGIGTASPGQKLEVVGNIKGQIIESASGGVKFPDGTVQASAATAVASPTVATQATQEAAVSLTDMVTPGRQQYHPSAAKAWVQFSGNGGTTINASYNVSSVTYNSAGNYTINFSTPFTNTNYAAIIIASAQRAIQAVISQTASSFNFNTHYTVNDAINDSSWISAVFYGDQ